jgi:GNAT superfamily N-acetyltransferase
MTPEVTIVPYSKSYQKAFKELNEAWISRFFSIEAEDIKTLSDPDKIIQEGGFIFVAIYNQLPIGVCALKKTGIDTFEFSKMAVSETSQGLGVGHQLLTYAIEQARITGAKTLFLEGNTKLEASIHLYRKFGFKEVTSRESHFERVDIIMELSL